MSVITRGKDQQSYKEKDAISYKPEYKPAPSLKLNPNIDGVNFNGVTDINEHDQAVKQHE